MTLIKQLEGAKYTEVREFEGQKYIWAWFGGHGVHSYDEEGNEVAFGNVGDFSEQHANLEEVKQYIEEIDPAHVWAH